MAEETTIPLDDGSAGSSVSEGLESTSHDAPSSSGDAAEDLARSGEMDELRKLNDQYKRERVGWETQSRRNLDERNALAERLARLEGRLETAGQGQAASGTPAAPAYAPGQLKSALQKWLDGDDSELSTVENAFVRPRTADAPAVTQDDLQKLVRAEVAALGTKATIQQAVGTRHPDMADRTSPLYTTVYEQYDAYASDQTTQLMYPSDPRYTLPMAGADGHHKMVDARIVDRLAAELRLSGAVQEGRRQEQRAGRVGQVQTGNGKQTSGPRTVEAIHLLTPGERAMLADPRVRKGIKDLPVDDKAAAKWLFDGLSQAERTKRLATFRQATRLEGV